jgi:1-acyl-sn-glycerol-3-phosphate acyltransferase
MSDFESRVRVWSERFVNASLGSFWTVQTTGLDRVPRAGPLILACNHASLLDGPLLGGAIATARRPMYLGKKELFDNRLLGGFLRMAGVIPLDRGTGGPTAMREALQILERGGSICVFPEGTRVKAGETRPPKLGVSFLAAKSGAPVLPTRLVGTREFPLVAGVEVRFGLPLPAPPEGREAAAAFARDVMSAIYGL